MLIAVTAHPGQLGDMWLVISLAVSFVAWVAARVVALSVALLLGTFAFLWIGTFTLIWLSALWHWCLDQLGQTQQPYDFWNDLRSIDDEGYDPIMRPHASKSYEAKDAT